MSEKSQNDLFGNVIGFPIGSVCRIVDPGDHNQLVAHGVVGELVIGRQILAGGYLDHCTGDLAKVDDTGNITIRGRKDNQIKIRGQRINVKEIQTTLPATNLIHNSVVELFKKGLLVNKLIAIISTTSDTPHCKHPPPLASHKQHLQTLALTLDSRLRTRLHDALQDRLTNAMIPKRWIRMTSIPETTSGKVNQKEIRIWLERTDEYRLKGHDTPTKSALLKPHLSFIQNGGYSIAAIELH
ncbi:nonribosomal peptide synthase [Fusarium circinatum]|uniref:Nonribosomal peptide synthase n=1 Tax=Fusarium circinatum TaxID=48490 RepID=A0A8H5TSG1_FUSCI|nr:nonribosomal peptide synthase [Fusarium circinatum]